MIRLADDDHPQIQAQPAASVRPKNGDRPVVQRAIPAAKSDDELIPVADDHPVTKPDPVAAPLEPKPSARTKMQAGSVTAVYDEGEVIPFREDPVPNLATRKPPLPRALHPEAFAPAAPRVEPERIDPATAPPSLNPHRPAAHAPAMVAPGDVHDHPHAYATDEPKKRQLRYWVMFLGVFVCALAYFLVRNNFVVPSNVFPGDDGEVKKLTATRGAFELSGWIDSHPRHSVRGMNDAMARNLAGELKALGAVKVLAFGEGQTDWLAIELPSSREPRRRLFGWENVWHKGMNQPVAQDLGQRYLLLHAPADTFDPSRKQN